jgi:sialic acid synthase SpsE
MLTIAEIGSNYRDLDDILNYVHRLKADVIKLQSFIHYELYGEGGPTGNYIGLPWLEKIKQECMDVDKDLMISCFYHKSVSMFDEFVDYHKVASSEITYIDLLEEMAKTGKQVFVSIGGAYHDEIERAVSIIGKDQIILMGCEVEYPSRSGYPWTVKDLAGEFDCRFGYSDHTTQVFMSRRICEEIGCHAWEKHVKFNSIDGKPDSATAITVIEFNASGHLPVFEPNPHKRTLQNGKWLRPR